MEHEKGACFLPLERAAHLLGMTSKDVQAWVETGQLVGTHRSDGWYIGQAEVAACARDLAAERSQRLAEWTTRNRITLLFPGD
jgi:hypothetical protein